MAIPRFRLRGLMLLVLVSGLVLGAWDQAGRLGPIDWDLVREGSIIFVPFCIMVALKLGLVIAMRARRGPPGESTDSAPRDDALP